MALQNMKQYKDKNGVEYAYPLRFEEFINPVYICKFCLKCTNDADELYPVLDYYICPDCLEAGKLPAPKFCNYCRGFRPSRGFERVSPKISACAQCAKIPEHDRPSPMILEK